MSRTFPTPWKNPFRLFAVAFAFTACASAATPAATDPAPLSSDPTVLTIDGAPVSAAEYTLVMNGRISEVFTYFHAKDGREDRLGYWKDDGQPENPIRKLRELTTDEFRTIKTVQSFAQKKGVIRDISYAAFKDGLLKENARRAQALEKKEVIYGPSQYKEHRYYYFQLADLRQAAFEGYQKEPANAVATPDVEAFYEANKDHFKDKPLTEVRDQIARALQKKAFEKLLTDTAANARVEVNEDALRPLAPRHDP